MKISIQQSVLSQHLDNAAKFLPKKDTIPILSQIVLSATSDGLEITAGNTETFIKSFIPTEDELRIHITIDRVGAIAIPGQKLAEIIKKMSDLVTIESESDQVVIKSGKSEFTLSTLDPEEYPAFPSVSGVSIAMKGKELKELVATTAYAASTSETTPILMGILFQQHDGVLQLTACDRHRLGQIKSECAANDFQIVVPGSTLVELSKIIGDGDVEISFDNSMLVRTNEFIFWTRVIDGTYPETAKLIPTIFKTEITVNKHELAAALDRIQIVARESKQNLMKLTINQNEIVIDSKEATKRATESVDVKGFTGDNLNVGLNGKYLSEALKAIEAVDIEIGLNGTMSPIIVRGKDELAFHMVLPYRITE